MRIFSPVPRDYHNIDALLSIGILDYYFGYMPKRWLKKYSLINAISAKNDLESYMLSESTVKGILKKGKAKGANFYITFNSPLYCTEHIQEIIKILKVFKNDGLTGVVLSDVGLIRAVKDDFPDLKLIASCESACLNYEHIRFLNNFGVDIITMPHSVTIQEIEKFKRMNPNVKFDVFANIQNCLNIVGHCTHCHSINNYDEAPCSEEHRFNKEFKEVEDPTAIRYFRLVQAGVDYIKIIGRGYNTKDIIKKNYLPILLVRKVNQLTPEEFDQWKRLFVRKIPELRNKALEYS